MNALLVDLRELQTLDDQLAHWGKVARSGPVRLAEARSRLTELESELGRLEEQYSRGKARQRELEAEVRDLAEKKAKNQARQMQAKNNDEYRALLKEEEHLTGQISLKEDEILDILDQLEKAAVEKEDVAALLTEEAALYASKAAEIETALAESEARHSEIQRARTALLPKLPADRLAQYESLAKNKAGVALAQVVNGMCLACRLSIPPQIFNQLQRNENIIVCPNCTRILYWRDHPDFNPPAENAPQ